MEGSVSMGQRMELYKATPSVAKVRLQTDFHWHLLSVRVINHFDSEELREEKSSS